jgi:hypothetical protein
LKEPAAFDGSIKTLYFKIKKQFFHKNLDRRKTFDIIFLFPILGRHL